MPDQTIDKILRSSFLIILISLIWGFGIAVLFKRACKGDQCVVIKVPTQFVNDGEVIRDRNRCYRLTRYYSPCTY